MTEPAQRDLAVDEEEDPSNESIIFGSDTRSADFVAKLAHETEAALLEGMGSLPGDVDGPHAVVETIMDPYKKKMDVLERFCDGSVFSIEMYDRSHQQRIVAALLRYRADPGSAEFHAQPNDRRPANDGSADNNDEEMTDADAALSADDLPTEAQVAEAQKRVADLRARLAQARHRQAELVRQVDAWRRVESKTGGTGDSGSAELLSADDAGKVHDVVSSAVVGTSMLTDLHQRGEDLLVKLQEERLKESGDGMDDEEGVNLATTVGAVPSSAPKKKTLEEQYADDRAVMEGSDGAPSATVKQLLRLLRAGKENAGAPFHAAS